MSAAKLSILSRRSILLIIAALAVALSVVLPGNVAYAAGPDFSTTVETKLTAFDAVANDRFGWSVSADSDTMVVGAWGDDDEAAPDAGAAYVFVRDTGGNWTQQAKLTA